MRHRECFGLSLCISGQITYHMNGKSFVSTRDCAVLLPQGASYCLVGEKDGLFPLVNFHCEGLACNEIAVIPLENPQSCITCFENLKKHLIEDQPHFEAFSWFYKLLQNISFKHTPKTSFATRAMKYIEKNLSYSDLTNASIADFLGISEVYLRKQFSSLFNTSPKQYIIDMRIQKAKQLLTDTPCSVTDIAEQCGFSSLYHFCRVFKKRTGITPTQYAQENRVYKI